MSNSKLSLCLAQFCFRQGSLQWGGGFCHYPLLRSSHGTASGSSPIVEELERRKRNGPNGVGQGIGIFWMWQTSNTDFFLLWGTLVDSSETPTPTPLPGVITGNHSCIPSLEAIPFWFILHPLVHQYTLLLDRNIPTTQAWHLPGVPPSPQKQAHLPCHHWMRSFLPWRSSSCLCRAFASVGF